MIKKLNLLLMIVMNLFASEAQESDFKKIPVGGQAVIEGVLDRAEIYFTRLGPIVHEQRKLRINGR